MELQATLLVDCKATLGEGVHWSPSRRRLYWSDIKGAALWSCNEDGGAVRQVRLEANLCDFAFADDGRFLAAFEDGLGWLDPVTGERSVFEPYMPDRPGTRMNDGALDRQGRFVVGGIDEIGLERITPVWLVDRGSVKPVLEDVAIANSLAFSPDGTAMYFADTPSGVILRYVYDSLQGIPSDPQVFAEAGTGEGLPDGATVDGEGGLWSARFAAGAVQRYRPDGTRDLRVTVPVPNVTNVAIGGRALRRLFVTTARIEMSETDLAQMPEAGGVFSVDIPVAGLPEGTYRR